MGRAVTTGEVERYGTVMKGSSDINKEEHKTLSEYIAEKVDLLHEMYYNWVTRETFVGCANEIQVDNRARTIIFGIQKRYMSY